MELLSLIIIIALGLLFAYVMLCLLVPLFVLVVSLVAMMIYGFFKGIATTWRIFTQ